MTRQGFGRAYLAQPFHGQRFLRGLILVPLLLGLLVLMALVNGLWQFWVGAASVALGWVWALLVLHAARRRWEAGGRLPLGQLLIPCLMIVVGFLAPWFFQPGLTNGRWTG